MKASELANTLVSSVEKSKESMVVMEVSRDPKRTTSPPKVKLVPRDIDAKVGTSSRETNNS